MILGALCWSTAGLLIRFVDAEPWAIVAWRSGIMAVAVLLGLVVRHRGGVVVAFRRLGWPGVASGALQGATFCLFVLAITRTTVANTLVIMAATPFVVALMSWVVLRERPSRSTWLAMSVVALGIGIMFSGGLGAGEWLGNVLALVVTVTFGANTLIVRRYRSVDMVPAVCLAGVFSAVVAAPLAGSLAVSAQDLVCLALLGIVQLSIGLALFVAAVRRLPAADVSVLGSLETVLGPIWVWIGVGERPSGAALVGGALVLATLTVYSLARRA